MNTLVSSRRRVRALGLALISVAGSHAAGMRIALCLLAFGLAPGLAAQAPDSTADQALRKGKLAAASKKWAVAIRYFDEARAAAPSLPEPLFTLGLAEAQLPGRELRAIGWFRAYLELAPDAPNAPAVRDQIEQLDIAAEERANDILALLTQVAAQFPAGGGQAGDGQSALAAVAAAIAQAGKARPAPPSAEVPMSAAQRAEAWCDYVQRDLSAPLFVNLQPTLAQAQSVSGTADNRAWTVFSHLREQADSWIARLAEVRSRYPEQRFVAGVLAERARKIEAAAAEARAIEAQKAAAARMAQFADELKQVSTFVTQLAAENGPTLVGILPGEFTMGGNDFDSEKPLHRVSISRPFYLGATDVTQALWVSVMGSNPSYFKGDNLPVEQVSWDDAMAFCKRLNERERAAGRLPAGWQFTLPTDAQWEYACRAGTMGDRYGDLDSIAWYASNSGGRTHPVGTKQPNAWGLYDMIGNVWQWCLDWYGNYPEGPVTDPTGPASGSYRVYRGGSWSVVAAGCRSAYRYYDDPGYRLNNIGFRLALSSVP